MTQSFFKHSIILSTLGVMALSISPNAIAQQQQDRSREQTYNDAVECRAMEVAAMEFGIQSREDTIANTASLANFATGIMPEVSQEKFNADTQAAIKKVMDFVNTAETKDIQALQSKCDQLLTAVRKMGL